jgi:hypothetical protein
MKLPWLMTLTTPNDCVECISSDAGRRASEILVRNRKARADLDRTMRDAHDLLATPIYPHDEDASFR